VIRSAVVHFNCPNCNALYQIVKVKAGPETIAVTATADGALIGTEYAATERSE
jgi:hypothetical protein